MPWVHKVKNDRFHECSTPNFNILPKNPGSVWECRKCHQRWRVTGIGRSYDCSWYIWEPVKQ